MSQKHFVVCVPRRPAMEPVGAVLPEPHCTLMSVPASLQLPDLGGSCGPTVTERIFLVNCLIVRFWKQLD